MSNQQAVAGCSVTVQGRVQGVGFRYFTRTHARRLHISGWVRNTRNGDVEIYAEGDRARLEAFVEIIRNGPPGSAVEQIDITWNTPQNRHNTFEILR